MTRNTCPRCGQMTETVTSLPDQQTDYWCFACLATLPAPRTLEPRDASGWTGEVDVTIIG